MSTLQEAGEDESPESSPLEDARIVDELRSRLDEAILAFDRLREGDADRRSWSRLESCAIRLARELRFLAAP